MAGRRLVDVAKLFNASKSIATKHIALRSNQLAAFNKTSSLAKAVKNQTDRVTLTAAAAIELSKRFSEEAPAYARAAAQQATRTRQHEDIPRKDTVQRDAPVSFAKEGLEQDHHYDRSEQNTTAGPPPETELEVEQKKASRRPLPDGTIPTAGVTLEQEEVGQDIFYKRPVPEAPKEPLVEEKGKPRAEDEEIKPVESDQSTIPLPGQPAGRSLAATETIPSHANDLQQPPKSSRIQSLETGHDRDVFYARSVESQPTPSAQPQTQLPSHTGTQQASDRHVDDKQLNQDVFYSQKDSREAQVAEQEDLPEGVNTDVFHSTRVAQMLGNDPYSKKEYARRQGPPSKNPFIPPQYQAGHGHETTAKGPSQTATPEPPIKQSQPATTEKEMQELASQLTQDTQSNVAAPEIAPEEVTTVTEPEKAPYALRESRVPSSRFGRMWQYAGLGTSMALGAVGESLRRVTGSAASTTGSLMLSPGNIEILVAKLSKMRGAALKLGQMISIQDMKMLPPQIHDVLQRVQDSADYMPASQRNKVLSSNLGDNWRDLFESFEEVPIAAASIGQVHKAVLKSNGQAVAVKIQYPGVAGSIDSDLSNLSVLLNASRLLPRGLFLDKTIANARTELAWECDYTREAECQMRFRDFLADDTEAFTVPKVFAEASGPSVLTAELMYGVGVTKLKSLNQEQRDWIGTQILRLCLREIVEFKFMQTDPNWTNFLYNAESNKIELLDFGASRDYPDEFVEPYVNILIGASKGDHTTIRDRSIELGYLTGDESPTMLDAHIQSVMTLAEPFKADGPEVYDFRDQTITDRVRSLIPVMVKERLAPPPEETYSLHRKLSGAFLLCARLGSRVPCRELFSRAIKTWEGNVSMKSSS
ncbi:ubiquinone biosynthesis protein-like protein coq-8 [Ophiobolus disseminans]|uniref:Ubiquinone biosynthesis protein-like protein coq-8 n=1 Tax=Ophiobolus disseminans TaxID=1469910 RepID=A0A6A6ZSL4_9PLEO|nr:ubiquinone biosynthesis protein-like protein coq-8 [Ophiobolus disseminans]